VAGTAEEGELKRVPIKSRSKRRARLVMSNSTCSKIITERKEKVLGEGEKRLGRQRKGEGDTGDRAVVLRKKKKGVRLAIQIIEISGIRKRERKEKGGEDYTLAV